MKEKHGNINIHYVFKSFRNSKNEKDVECRFQQYLTKSYPIIQFFLTVFKITR